MTESRNQRYIREFNERLDRDKGILWGMTKDERRVLTTLILIATLVAVGVTWVLASDFEMDIQCIEQKCMVDKKQLHALIENNNAVTLKLDSVIKSKCNNLRGA